MKPIISSRRNHEIKTLYSLRKQKERRKQGLFLIDGILPLRQALESSLKIKKIYFTEEKINVSINQLAKKQNIPLQPITNSVNEKITYGNRKDGYTAVAHIPDLSVSSLQLTKNPLIILSESLEKPGNIGAIIRSAEAAGADLHITASPITDIYNPNIIRNSRGAIFRLKQAVLSSEEAREWFKENQIKVFAARPGNGPNYTEVDFTGPTAILIGNEHSGLSSVWKDVPSIQIRMKGTTDSLNAAQSATLLLFEALRQRDSIHS